MKWTETSWLPPSQIPHTRSETGDRPSRQETNWWSLLSSDRYRPWWAIHCGLTGLHHEISSSQEATQLHSTNPSTRWGHTGHTGSDTAISASLDMYQAEACGDTLRRWGRGSGWTSRPGPPWWWPTPGRRRVAGGLRQSGSFLSCENIYIESLEHLHV